MWWKSPISPDYTVLKSNGGDLIAEDVETEAQIDSSRCQRQRPLYRIAPWLVHLIFLSISSALLFKATQLSSKKSTSLAPSVTQELAQAVADVGAYYRHKLSGDFFASSIYRGAPSPELDAAWDNLWETGSMAVSREDMLRIQKLAPSSVKLPEEPEESYQAGFEFVHQLHCLNMIRQYTYYDYYSALSPEFASPMKRRHTDHCIELLRQHLMCAADLHVFTYNWNDRIERAWPDFNTTKMCRNFEDVRAWGMAHHATTSAEGGLIRRPEGVELLHVPSDEEPAPDAESQGKE